MKVYQCGFIASQGIGAPDCSKGISSPTPNQVSVDGIELEQIYPGGWGFGLGSTKNGALYSWGVNQATLLGKSGSADDGADPSTLDIIADEVTTAAAGFDHIVFAQNQGTAVFALGPSFPSSSPPSSPSSSLHLTPIPLPLPPSHSVISTSCGEHHTLLLLSSGDVYGFGSNAEGQLGIPLSTTTVPPSQPVHILGPFLPSSSTGSNNINNDAEINTMYTVIAAGARHSVALTSSGRCIVFGWSLHAQCGELSPTVSTPTVITALGPLKCTSAAAGSGHTLVATEDGAVYAWGQNNDGQCCQTSLSSSSSSSSSSSGEHSAMIIIKPTLVEAVEDTIVKIAAGSRHSVLLSDKGRVYAFGFGKFGQLGGGRGVEGGGGDVSPTQMMIVPDGCETVVDIACGWWHTLLVCE